MSFWDSTCNYIKKKDIIVREDKICFGEVGLSGGAQNTMSSACCKRQKAWIIKSVLFQNSVLRSIIIISGIEIVGVANIKEAIEAVR